MSSTAVNEAAGPRRSRFVVDARELTLTPAPLPSPGRCYRVDTLDHGPTGLETRKLRYFEDRDAALAFAASEHAAGPVVNVWKGTLDRTGNFDGHIIETRTLIAAARYH